MLCFVYRFSAFCALSTRLTSSSISSMEECSVDIPRASSAVLMIVWGRPPRYFLLNEYELGCHNCDHTYPYSPYPNLSTPILSHLNHSRAPNTKPEPSDPLASQQRTPEHSDSLASSQCIPDPTHLRPFLSLVSSRFLTPTPIPNPMLIRPLLFLASSRFPTTTLIPDLTPFDLHSFTSSLFPTFHRSRDCGRAKPDHVPPLLDAS